MRKLALFFSSAFLFLVKFLLPAETHGRIDVAPVALKIDVLEFGHSVDTLHMYGGRLDATLQVAENYGFVLKPCVFGASGEGDFVSGGIALGHYTPITSCLNVTPTLGYSYTELKTTINIPAFGLTRQREKFKSNTAVLGVEVGYTITPKWAITGVYQYGFARTHTTIGHIIHAKARSQGPNWGAILDYTLCDHWLISAAVGYNNSLSKEKHGIRGLGYKLGVAYTY